MYTYELFNCCIAISNALHASLLENLGLVCNKQILKTLGNYIAPLVLHVK